MGGPRNVFALGAVLLEVDPPIEVMGGTNGGGAPCIERRFELRDAIPVLLAELARGFAPFAADDDGGRPGIPGGGNPGS